MNSRRGAAPGSGRRRRVKQAAASDPRRQMPRRRSSAASALGEKKNFAQRQLQRAASQLQLLGLGVLNEEQHEKG